MRAGQLDRRLTLISSVTTNTGTGFIEDDVVLGTVWGSRTDVSDGEKAAAGSVQSAVRARFVVRSSSLTRELEPKDRLREDRLTFEILGIKEIGRHDALEITAEARLE